jgi:hypothetical protein
MMSILLWIAGGFALLVVLGMLLGWGSNTVFTNPQSLSDAHLERTIRLSQRMMDNSPVGSEQWSKAGDKFSAAFREQMRRRGTPLPDRVLETGIAPPETDELEIDWPEVEEGQFDELEEREDNQEID